LNPAVTTTTNLLKESKNLAEKLAWLVLVDLWSMKIISNSATMQEMFTHRSFDLPSSSNTIREQS
jgi:hypothetical protein